MKKFIKFQLGKMYGEANGWLQVCALVVVFIIYRLSPIALFLTAYYLRDGSPL
ncbi:hypothetical protein U8P73_36295 (plasmid) [Rhizobium beringeri]|uniref:hypothetical protein n=1 Tax=Rhizobium beringeri TaxID=3019934 RepID=UPI002DDD4509|nr:hypothetical protein [Rhizobium beringeri]WSG93612.1 hypothetical protein U8P73_36295 [Rhizobium beringeri]